MAKMLHIPQIGDHYKIITFEKNENPQNIMVVYTKLDKDCRFVTTDGQPLVDFYWLMDGERYKPTHSLIKQAVRKRLEVTAGAADGREFRMKVNDLKELGTNIANPNLTVRAEKSAGECRVVSYFPDEKASGKLIQVSSLYSESKKTFTPPFRKLLAVTIRGIEAGSGEDIQRKYVAR